MCHQLERIDSVTSFIKHTAEPTAFVITYFVGCSSFLIIIFSSILIISNSILIIIIIIISTYLPILVSGHERFYRGQADSQHREKLPHPFAWLIINNLCLSASMNIGKSKRYRCPAYTLCAFIDREKERKVKAGLLGSSTAQFAVWCVKKRLLVVLFCAFPFPKGYEQDG